MKYFVVRDKDGEVFRKNGLFYGNAAPKAFRNLHTAIDSASTLAKYHHEKMRVDQEDGISVCSAEGNKND